MLTRKIISFQNKPISYYTESDGPALIFLHGFCEDHTIWYDFMQPFLNQYKIIAADFPGFGHSQSLEGTITIDLMADLGQGLFNDEGFLMKKRFHPVA